MKLIRIHIDGMSYDFGPPYTGKRLREIAGVTEDEDLWHDCGSKDDELVLSNFDTVNLEDSRTFYTAPKIINGG